MSDREKEILEKIVKLLSYKLEPTRIILFGSRAKKRDVKGHPDFDLAVQAPTPTPNDELKLKDEIEEIAGLYKVDLLFLDKVDSEFKRIILKTGKVVYER